MKNSTSLFMVSMMFFVSIGCKKDLTSIEEDLVGKWTVTQVRLEQFTSGEASYLITDDNPSGFINFSNNGRGSQDYSYSVIGTAYPNNGSFVWSATDLELIIRQMAQPNLVFQREVNYYNIQELTYSIVINPKLTIDYTLTIVR